MTEQVVAGLQAFLDEADGPFQTSVTPGYKIETVLVSLVDDLWREMDKGSATVDCPVPLSSF